MQGVLFSVALQLFEEGITLFLKKRLKLNGTFEFGKV